MNFIEKLNQLLEQNKIRISDLSRGSGVPYTTIDGFYKKGWSNIKLSTLKQIADYFGVTIDYLVNDDYSEEAFENDRDIQSVVSKYSGLDDMGKRIVKSELDKQCERVRKVLESNSEDYISIPYFEDKAAAGTGYQLGDGAHETIRVLRSRKTDRADFIVTVSGQSMEPEYYDGENVLVHSQPDIFEGEIGIFVVNGNGFIKKKGKDRLISLNHKFRDIFLSADDNVICAGKVVGKLEPDEII